METPKIFEKLAEQGQKLFHDSQSNFYDFQENHKEFNYSKSEIQRIVFVNKIYDEWMTFWSQYQDDHIGGNVLSNYDQLYVLAANDFLKERTYFIDNDWILARTKHNETLIFNIEKYLNQK